MIDDYCVVRSLIREFVNELGNVDKSIDDDNKKRLFSLIDELFAAAENDSFMIRYALIIPNDDLSLKTIDRLLRWLGCERFEHAAALRRRPKFFREPLTKEFVREVFLMLWETLNSDASTTSNRDTQSNLLSWLQRCIDEGIPHVKEKINAFSKGKRSDPLGLVAFPNDRVNNDGDDLLPEPNTDVEDQLLGALRSHFETNFHMSKDNGMLLHSLLKQGLYTDVFHEPPDGIVYRSMGVDTAWLKKLLDKHLQEDIPKIGGKTNVLPLSR